METSEKTKTAVANAAPLNPMKAFFTQDKVKKSFEELLSDRAPQFITTILQNAANNKLLAKADPVTIMNAALTAAALDLPINPNLGFAYIIPYGNSAQFQMGYKGYIQLAIRSGMFKTISATPIYKGQIVSEDPLTGYVFDFTKKSTEVVGYAAYFELLSGFQKTLYMSKDEVVRHAKRYSKSFNSGPWQTHFDEMARKTVLKMLIATYSPLSVQMQKAVQFDQSVQKHDIGEIEQVEFEEMSNDPDAQDDILAKIEACKTTEELVKLHASLPPGIHAEKWYQEASDTKELNLQNAGK